MWKYVTCCLRETLQRSANYFDVRCGAGLTTHHQRSVAPENKNGVRLYENKQKCSGNFGNNNTEWNDFNWHRCHLLNSCINAFTWSGAIVLGWYASQLHCINNKRKHAFQYHHAQKKCIGRYILLNTKAIQKAVLPNVVLAHPNEGGITTQNIVNSIRTNEEANYNPVYSTQKQTSSDIQHENHLDVAVKGLVNVLNSVENNLGLAAIEGGDLKYGTEMLQSAAHRNYAPALYNLALCYQKGIGVNKDENVAAELYQTAASLEHPAAMYNLAVFHGQGRGGLARNPEAAEKLLRMAALKGQEDAIKALSDNNSCTECSDRKVELNLSNNIEPYVDKINNDSYPEMQSVVNIITDTMFGPNDTQKLLLF